MLAFHVHQSFGVTAHTRLADLRLQCATARYYETRNDAIPFGDGPIYTALPTFGQEMSPVNSRGTNPTAAVANPPGLARLP